MFEVVKELEKLKTRNEAQLQDEEKTTDLCKPQSDVEMNEHG